MKPSSNLFRDAEQSNCDHFHAPTFVGLQVGPAIMKITHVGVIVHDGIPHMAENR
jgi:hypothetical protein